MNRCINQGRRAKSSKFWKVMPFPQKARKTVYSSLEDFLRKFPIAAANEYGEFVISGKRIC